MAEEENNNQELTGAVDEMRDSVAAFTYDGDRSAHDHVSGAPEERELVLGDDDPRDAGLAEKPLTEDVAWTGRIFNVNRLQVELPDGRRALRDVVRHPGYLLYTSTYRIHEEGQDGDGWALDKDTKVTVTVAENADRSLAAAVSYDRKADGADAAEFTNAYAADGSATVMVKKTVNGEAPEQNKQFTFQLKDEAGNVLSEAITTGNAAAQFAPIKYTLADAGKTFSYTVHESTPAAAGYTNAADKAVTVEVSADNGTGKLKTTVAYDGQGEEDQASATMNNTYVAASGEFQLGLVKTVNGGAPLPGER
ncbi:MAG: hypothetical protein DBX94_08215, partial [Coriobacteriia bacterium]